MQKEKIEGVSSPLSGQNRAVILGSILGDGSLKLNKGYKNARFSFRHSVSQKEYFFWKAKLLSEIAGEKYFWEQNGSGFGTGKMLRFQSKALGSLTQLYELTHRHGKFTIRRKWLNQLTPLSLAVWWLDDGSLISNARKGVLCTDGFLEEEVQILRQYLKKVWKVETHVGPVGKIGKRSEYFRLWIRSTEELKKFLRIILPCIKVESLLYKVLILYNDFQMQQRWISEVCHHTGFDEKLVTKYLNEKKNKWKKYKPSENDIVRSL